MNDDAVIQLSPPPKVPVATSARRKQPALGRGLGALLGEMRREEPVGAGDADDAAVPAEGLAMIAIGQIEPLPGQPRRRFDEDALDELAASIAQRGVIQPIIVRRQGKDRYQLVAGERRWRAAQRAHLHEVPALVRELGDRDVMALALIENLQRQDLNPVEEARAYHRLAEDEGLTQADIARMVDKSRSHVANLQRLLALPESVLTMVEIGTLSMGHARALIGSDAAEAIAGDAVARQLSVRQVERLVRSRASAERTPARRARGGRNDAESADIAAVQQNLEEVLGLSVRIAVDAEPGTGTVTISYRSLDQLDLICERLSGSMI